MHLHSSNQLPLRHAKLPRAHREGGLLTPPLRHRCCGLLSVLGCSFSLKVEGHATVTIGALAPHVEHKLIQHEV